LATVAAVAVVTGILLPIGAANASPADTQLASEDPVNYTPRVQDGRVQSIVRTGETVIVGGTFTSVLDATTNQTLPRVGIFAFNATTGAVSTTFHPVITAKNGKAPGVDVVALNPTGTGVYVGGAYNQINGSGPARLQALSLSDGTQLSTFKNKAFSSRVYDVKLSGNTLYVSGSFKNVGGVDRRGIATLDATTGELTDKVNLPFTGTAQGFGASGVRKMDITPSGDRLIAIGNFSSVAGQSRVQAAMLNTSGATATLDSWRTSSFTGTACGSAWDTYLHDVDLSPDGSFFIIVTTGGYHPSTMCDTASRWETHATGDQTSTWTSITGGDTSWAVEVTGPVAYVGGHFRWWNNTNTDQTSFPGDTAGPGAVARPGLVALDTRNGVPFSWNPTRSRGVGVFDFFVTNSELWAGSDTPVWAGERRDRLAAFPWQGGLPLPSDKLGSVPGDVVQLDADTVTGADVTSRYLVNSSAPVTTTLGSGGINWANVRGAFMVNNTLYTGWTDGTFKKQSFDGNTFGPQTTINVKGEYTGTNVTRLLTADLTNSTQKLSSMFYDPRTGRLYFTRAGTTKQHGQSNNDGGLYYRYFTPESDIVGDTRWDKLRSSSVSAIGADTIRGAFLSGDWLYYVTSSGELRKIQFSAAGAFVGSSQSVNNSINWSAKGLFLSTQPSIQAPNADPTASFTQTCIGLSCSFDGTASGDTDGTIASYSWNFGDGSGPETGATPNHIFPSGGSYPVTLTVTDNDGAQDQFSTNVSVAPITTQVAFRTASSFSGGQVKTPKWNLPDGIQAGDTIVMAVSGHLSADPGVVRDGTSANNPLPGWSEIADTTDSDTRTVLYVKTASASDAGSKVGVAWTSDGTTAVSVKTFAAVSVYSGVAATSPVTSAVETSTKNVSAHTTPDITVPTTGDWVLSYWSDKSNSTTDWAAPGNQQVRAEGTSIIGADPTNVRVSGFLTDDGAPTVGGARSGITATTDGKSTSVVMISLVLHSQ
jgi:hypothetical protein